MAVTRSWNTDILDPRFSAITMTDANKPGVYEKIVSVEAYNPSVDKMPDKIKTAEYGGLGPFTETQERKAFDFDDPSKGYTKETNYKKFALAVEFSEEVKDDDLYGVCDTVAGEIGKSYKLTRELQTAQIYDNAFATTYFTTGDAAALCSSSHLSTAGGGNRTNILSGSYSSTALSYAGVKNLLITAYRQKDDRGYPSPGFMPGDPVRVLHQPEDQFIAGELFSNLSTYEPGTNNNTPNTLLLNHKFELINNMYQTATGGGSARYWFLINGSDPGIILKDRMPLTTSTYTRDGDKSLVYDGRCRYWFHTPTWRGIYGSGN